MRLGNHPIWKDFICQKAMPCNLDAPRPDFFTISRRDTNILRFKQKSLMAYYGDLMRIADEVLIEFRTPKYQQGCKAHNNLLSVVEWPVNSGKDCLAWMERAWVSGTRRGPQTTHIVMHNYFTKESMKLSGSDLSIRVLNPAFRQYIILWHKVYVDCHFKCLKLVLTLRDEYYAEFEYETTEESELKVFSNAGLPVEPELDWAWCAVFSVFHAAVPMRLVRFEKNDWICDEFDNDGHLVWLSAYNRDLVTGAMQFDMKTPREMPTGPLLAALPFTLNTFLPPV